MRILLVEDEMYLSEALVHILNRNGYAVDAVYNGEQALEKLAHTIYDFILLDLMIPKPGGYEVLYRIRKAKNSVPVMILTAKIDVDDRIKGLELGADDYLPKPFETEELLARIKAVLRRGSELEPLSENIHFGGLSLIKQSMSLQNGDRAIKLSSKEFEMLDFFFLNSDIVVTKQQIFAKIWGENRAADDNLVEVFVSFLRKKLKFLKSKVTIKTIRGAGYKICLKD